MRPATFALALFLTFAAAGEAPAQRSRFFFWQPAPSPIVSPSPGVAFQPWSYYQSHWIYDYMPYGYSGYPYASWGSPLYAGYPYGWGAPMMSYGAFPYGYQSIAPVQDYGPPARARTSLYPAIPYSEFAAREQQQAGEGRGYITVQVPATDAKVWINDKLIIVILSAPPRKMT